MTKVKCYSVRLESLTPISEKAYKATAFDGSTAIIPKSQVFGPDYDVQKSEAYWISAWILEKKNLQYSTKKYSFFDKDRADRKVESGVEIERHIPETKEPITIEPLPELVKSIPKMGEIKIGTLKEVTGSGADHGLYLFVFSDKISKQPQWLWCCWLVEYNHENLELKNDEKIIIVNDSVYISGGFSGVGLPSNIEIINRKGEQEIIEEMNKCTLISPITSQNDKRVQRAYKFYDKYPQYYKLEANALIFFFSAKSSIKVYKFKNGSIWFVGDVFLEKNTPIASIGNENGVLPPGVSWEEGLKDHAILIDEICDF